MSVLLYVYACLIADILSMDQDMADTADDIQAVDHMDMYSETYSESSHSTTGSYIAIQLKLVAIAYYIAILYIKLYI